MYPTHDVNEFIYATMDKLAELQEVIYFVKHANVDEGRKWADKVYAKYVKQNPQYKFKKITDAQLKDMFPTGWEKQHGSAQNAVANSTWMRDMNNAKAGFNEPKPPSNPNRSKPGGGHAPSGGKPYKAPWGARARYYAYHHPKTVRAAGIGLGVTGLGALGYMAHRMRYSPERGVR